LGTGSISERPIVVGGMLALCPTVNMTLSSDHRVLDGVAAAKFLQDIKEMIEQA
jgi:pyruvate dehydrogenase E2 component (dihydrolipoamide acetyltransferase)